MNNAVQMILEKLALMRALAKDTGQMELMQDIGAVIYAHSREPNEMVKSFRESRPDEVAALCFQSLHEACDALEPYLQGPAKPELRRARLLGAALGAVYMSAHAGAMDIFVNDYCAPFMVAFEEWRQKNEQNAIERPRLFDVSGKKVFTATDNVTSEPTKAPLQFPSIVRGPEEK